MGAKFVGEVVELLCTQKSDVSLLLETFVGLLQPGMLFLVALVHESGDACLVSGGHGLGLLLHLIHLNLHVAQLLKGKTVMASKRPVALAQLKQGTHASIDLTATLLRFGSPIGWMNWLRRRGDRVWRLCVGMATRSVRERIIGRGARSGLAWVLLVVFGLGSALGLKKGIIFFLEGGGGDGATCLHLRGKEVQQGETTTDRGMDWTGAMVQGKQFQESSRERRRSCARKGSAMVNDNGVNNGPAVCAQWCVNQQ